MSYILRSIIDAFGRFDPLVAAAPAVVIRAAHDADLPSLHDLAELDSAVPLTGPVLVALVHGRPGRPSPSTTGASSPTPSGRAAPPPSCCACGRRSCKA